MEEIASISIWIEMGAMLRLKISQAKNFLKQGVNKEGIGELLWTLRLWYVFLYLFIHADTFPLKTLTH